MMLIHKHKPGCGCVGKSVAPVNDAVRASSRPMRWKSAEQLAKRFVRAVLDAHVRCVAGIISDLPGNDTWASVARATKMLHVAEKKLTPGEVDRLMAQAALTIDPILLSQIMQRIGALQLELWPEDSSPETVADNTLLQGQFPQFLTETYKEGLKEGFNRVSNAGVTEVQFESVFNPNSLFAQKMYTEGYKYVTTKITKDFMPEVLKVMMKGVTAGDSWTDISTNLYKETGTGYLWQWQRLVRTEMTRAFDLSFTEEFVQYGVEAVKWSAAIGACPICQNIAQTNRGYYPIVDRPHIPEDTHPNCRCDLIPVYDLPIGVKV